MTANHDAARIRKLALKFYRDTSSGILFTPSWKNIFNFNLWKAVLYPEKKGLDYDYWNERGWFNSGYYDERKVSIIKRAAGYFFCRLIRAII